MGRDRRRVEHASRDLGVLCAQRAHDVVGADVVGGSLVGIDPDPHGVVTFTKQLKVRDAGQPRNTVADLEHVVGNIFGAARAVRRIDMDAEEKGLDRLLDLDSLSLHLLGQTRQRVLNTILRK